MPIEHYLNACYTAKVLRSGVGLPEAINRLREALKTDADLLNSARRKRSAMELVKDRDFRARVMKPVLDTALEGLDDWHGIS